MWTGTALCVLPAKETLEELIFKDEGMTTKKNVLYTFIIVFVSYLFALFIPSIGDAMALAGCTTNPMIGFIIPILMHWKIVQAKKWYSKEKLISGAVAVLIVLTSVLGLINFVIQKCS